MHVVADLLAAEGRREYVERMYHLSPEELAELQAWLDARAEKKAKPKK